MQSPFRDTEVFTDDMIGCLGFASKGTKREGSGWTCVRGQQIEAPFVFDWENAIALDAMQGNRASSLGEGEVS